MHYLFWNTNRKTNINSMIKNLITKFTPDIIALAEYECDIKELLDELKKESYILYEVPQLACRVRILTKFKTYQIKHKGDSIHFTIKTIPHPNYGKHIVVFVHFPSKMYPDNRYIDEIIRELKRMLGDAQTEENVDKVVMLGDFNMNPFEEPMVAANGLHAVSSRAEAKKQSRIVGGTEYRMFYNPMWNLMGDYIQPTGTYFYNKSGCVTYFWNIFDQVIVSPQIMDDLILESIKIVNEIDGIRLDKANGRPEISDHFPLYFKIGGI